MNRGDIWIGSGNTDYTGKPRPMLIVQADDLIELKAVVVCPISALWDVENRFRLVVRPTPDNGLKSVSRIMVDKVSALPRIKIDRQIGRLETELMTQVETALIALLDLA